MIPDQRVAFASDSLRDGPRQDLVGVIVGRFAALGFVSRPIEAKRAVIEERGEPPTILLFLIGITATRKKEQVAPEQEIVTRLLESDFDTAQKLALCVFDPNDGARFAITLNSVLCGCKNFRVDGRCFLVFSAPGGSGEQNRCRGSAGAKKLASSHRREQTGFWIFGELKFASERQSSPERSQNQEQIHRIMEDRIIEEKT